jgi:MFS family permease
LSKLKFVRYDYAAFLSFFAYAAGVMVIPVALMSLSAELGFSIEDDGDGGMTAAGVLEVARTSTMVLSMLLCGFVAGRFGKRRTLGGTVALMSLGVAICAIAPIYGILFLAMLIVGFGQGGIEGLATPFTHDLHPDEPGRYINFTHSFWSVGVLVTVLVSGALLSLGVSWRILVGAAAGLGFIAAGVLLGPERKGHEYPEHPEPIHWSEVASHGKQIVTRSHFWLFFAAMFVAGGGEFGLTYWIPSFIQKNFLPEAWAGGVGTACFAGGMFLGRTMWGHFIRQDHLKQLVVFSAIGGTLVTLSFMIVTNPWVMFGLLFVAGVASAPFWPSVQSYCATRLKNVDTTMLFILLSCAGIPGCGFATLMMGYIGDKAGDLRMAFLLIPACYVVLGTIIGFEWLAAARADKRQQLQKATEEST